MTSYFTRLFATKPLTKQRKRKEWNKSTNEINAKEEKNEEINYARKTHRCCASWRKEKKKYTHFFKKSILFHRFIYHFRNYKKALNWRVAHVSICNTFIECDEIICNLLKSHAFNRSFDCKQAKNIERKQINRMKLKPRLLSAHKKWREKKNGEKMKIKKMCEAILAPQQFGSIRFNVKWLAWKRAIFHSVFSASLICQFSFDFRLIFAFFLAFQKWKLCRHNRR